MYYFRLVWTVSLCAALSGCGTEPVFYPDEVVVLTATVVNGVGQPLAGLSVTDTVSRTGEILHVSAGSPSTDLPADGSQATTIFSDAFIQAIMPTGDDVVVAVTAGGHSGSGRYRFGANGCHVQRLAGPDTLVVT
jgi:hypothetical protein